MTIFKKPNLTSALDAEGNWKHVNEVDSGLACNCFCPHCGARLVAINSKPEGQSKAHHFAHERGSDCVWSDESTLHKLAKEVLAEEQKVMLPIIQGEAESRQLEFDSVEQESRDKETGLIPDCVCYYGGQRLWVEFKRTHEVNTKKAEIIREAKIDCIEIDLNVCKIDKNSVREFITGNPSNRIWVYNSKTEQAKSWKEHGVRNEACYSEHDYILIDRHLAYDEMACLVYLNNVEPDYDIASHRYYCLNCGQELKIVNDHFEHVVNNTKCVDDFYLLKSAREVIYYNFYNSKKYEVVVPKLHICENFDSCEFADKGRCYTEGCEAYDLKEVGYEMCEKSARFPGHMELFDIVIRKTQSLEDAIVINLFTEDCDRDLRSEFRQVEICISCEDDVIRLAETLNIGCFRNFSEDSSRKAKPSEIQASILKFSLYRSGRAFIGPVSCTKRNFPRNKEVIKEYLFHGELPSIEMLRLYSLLNCYEHKLTGCYCEICNYLRRNPGYSPICIRYKTKNTPRNPLDSKPCNCAAFGLNLILAEELRDACNNVTLEEPNLING